MNRTIEAVLRLSAKLGPMDALSTVQKKLGAVYQTSEAANRRQSAWVRTTKAMYADVMPMLTRYAGPAAIAYGAYKVGQAASTMEDALFGIQKKTGATEAQLESLRQQIKDMARDVPVSMSEIAAAFERGGAAGIPLDQLRDFAELTTKVADAWDMAAEDVGNAFAGFEAGMGIAREDLEAFADLINFLADSGIADEADIVNFVDRVGASLKNFGLAKEEIAAYGAAMLNLKIPAEVAARAMDTLTGKLIAPGNLSEKARNALGDIVGDIDEFARLIEQDAARALDLFFEKLSKFSNADRALFLGGLLGEGFDDEVMRLSAGVEELGRNLDLVGQKEKYLGGVSAAAQRKMELWSSQVQILKNNFEGLADSLGAPVLGELNKLLTGANEMMDRQAEIGAGREKLTKGGFSEGKYYAEYQERYRKVHGDTGWSIAKAQAMQERYRSDLAAYGRGEIGSLFGNLDRDAETERRRQVLLDARGQYAGLEAMRLSAVRRDVVPTRDPRSIPLAEQYGSYGKAESDARRDAAVRRMNADPLAAFTGQGVTNAVGDLERRLDAALSSGGEKAGSSIEEAGMRAGENAGSAFGQRLNDAARAFGEAAASSFNSNVRTPLAFPGDTGQSVVSPDDL